MNKWVFFFKIPAFKYIMYNFYCVSAFRVWRLYKCLSVVKIITQTSNPLSVYIRVCEQVFFYIF